MRGRCAVLHIPVRSCRHLRGASSLCDSISHSSAAEKQLLRHGFLTHVPTHNRKKWGGKERTQEQVCAEFPQRKGRERAGKRWFESLDTLRNQQVACSSHVTSSRQAPCPFGWGACTFLDSWIDAVVNSRHRLTLHGWYDKICTIIKVAFTAARNSKRLEI